MNKLLNFLSIALTAILVLTFPAMGQTAFKTPTAGSVAQGVVVMCLDGSSQAIPATAAGTCLGSGGGGGAITGNVGVLNSGSTQIDPATTATDTNTGAIATSTSNTATSTASSAASLTTLAGAISNAIPAGSAIIGKVGIDQTTPGTTNGVQINAALPAGTALVGKVGIDQTTPGTTNAVATTNFPTTVSVNTGATGASSPRVTVAVDSATVAGSATLPAGTNSVGGVTIRPSATFGATAYGLQSAASTNSTSVKGSAGTLLGLNPINTTTTIYYLRMYDASSAPTCSSATNFSRTWPVPPASAAGGAGGIAVHLPVSGVAFANGIAFCLTGGPTSTDNTNAATGVFINLDYN